MKLALHSHRCRKILTKASISVCRPSMFFFFLQDLNEPETSSALIDLKVCVLGLSGCHTSKWSRSSCLTEATAGTATTALPVLAVTRSCSMAPASSWISTPLRTTTCSTETLHQVGARDMDFCSSIHTLSPHPSIHSSTIHPLIYYLFIDNVHPFIHTSFHPFNPSAYDLSIH